MSDLSKMSKQDLMSHLKSLKSSEGVKSKTRDRDTEEAEDGIFLKSARRSIADRHALRTTDSLTGPIYIQQGNKTTEYVPPLLLIKNPPMTVQDRQLVENSAKLSIALDGIDDIFDKLRYMESMSNSKIVRNKKYVSDAFQVKLNNLTSESEDAIMTDPAISQSNMEDFTAKFNVTWGGVQYVNLDVKLPDLLPSSAEDEIDLSIPPATVIDSVIDMRLDPNQSPKAQLVPFLRIAGMEYSLVNKGDITVDANMEYFAILLLM